MKYVLVDNNDNINTSVDLSSEIGKSGARIYFLETKKLDIKEFNKLLDVSKKEVNESKTFLNGSFLINMEDTAKSAYFITLWSMIGKEELFENYIENIEKVKVEDVKRIVDKYFTDPVYIILRPK